MGFQTRLVFSFVAALVNLLGGSFAQAQDRSWGDINVAGENRLRLVRHGSAAALAVRTTRTLTSNVRVEFGALFAKPEQQFGPSTLFVPEAQLQYRWNLGRVSPYVGGGIGAALVRSDVATTGIRRVGRCRYGGAIERTRRGHRGVPAARPRVEIDRHDRGDLHRARLAAAVVLTVRPQRLDGRHPHAAARGHVRRDRRHDSRTSALTPNVHGSSGSTWNSNRSSKRVSVPAATSPTTTPINDEAQRLAEDEAEDRRR